MNNPMGGSRPRTAETWTSAGQAENARPDFEAAEGVVKNTNTEVERIETAESGRESVDVVKNTQTEAEAPLAEIAGQTSEVDSPTPEANNRAPERKETPVQRQEYLQEDEEDRKVEDGTGWEHDIVMQTTEKLAKTAMKIVKSEVAGMTHPGDLDRKRLKWTKELLLSAYDRKFPGRAA